MLSLDASLLDHPTVGRDLAMKQVEILGALNAHFSRETIHHELRLLGLTVLGVQNQLDGEFSNSMTAALEELGFVRVDSSADKVPNGFNFSFGVRVSASTIDSVDPFETVILSVCVGIWARNPEDMEIHLYSVSPAEVGDDLIWALSSNEDDVNQAPVGVTHWVAPGLCF